MVHYTGNKATDLLDVPPDAFPPLWGDTEHLFLFADPSVRGVPYG